MTKLEKLIEEKAKDYSINYPNKQEWIRGEKDTHNYMSYEVKYQIEEAYEDGFKEALKPEHMKLTPEVKTLLKTLKKLSNFGEGTRRLGKSSWDCLEEMQIEMSERMSFAKEALKPFEEGKIKNE
jgi:hypothetical protein